MSKSQETAKVQDSGTALRSTIPKDVANETQIQGDDLLVFEAVDEGELRVRKVETLLERADAESLG